MAEVGVVSGAAEASEAVVAVSEAVAEAWGVVSQVDSEAQVVAVRAGSLDPASLAVRAEADLGSLVAQALVGAELGSLVAQALVGADLRSLARALTGASAFAATALASATASPSATGSSVPGLASLRLLATGVGPTTIMPPATDRAGVTEIGVTAVGVAEIGGGMEVGVMEVGAGEQQP
jgi:hypothetical protein